MDRLRKVFKKSPSSHPSPAPATQKGDHFYPDRSMPLRDHNYSTEFGAHRPVYRGPTPLRPSDIKYVQPDSGVLDISSENSKPCDDDDPFYRDNKLDKRILDKFPTPPDAVTFPPVPILNPAPLRKKKMAEFDSYTPADLLPPNPFIEPWTKEREEQRYMEQAKKYQYIPSQSQSLSKHSHRQQTQERSNSSASYSHPTPDVYPNLSRRQQTQQRFNSSASYARPTPDAYPNVSHPKYPPPTPHPNAQAQTLASMNRSHTHPTYQTAHANLSTKTLGSTSRSRAPHVRVVQGPIAHRPVVRQASTPAIHHQVVYEVPPLPDMPFHPAVLGAVHRPREPERSRLVSNPGHAGYAHGSSGRTRGAAGYTGYP